jgi:hypothetical protein
LAGRKKTIVMRPEPTLHGPVVRHNGHTLLHHNHYGKGLSSIERVSFRCKVCGLAAAADKYGNQWKNWIGNGAETSCGDAVAKEVMES